MTRMTPDKADQKLELLDKALKDANIVLADFKSTIREGKKLLADIDKVVASQVGDKVETVVADHIARLGEATQKAIEDAEKGVYARFDQVQAILLGEDKQSRREGRKSIPELMAELPYCTVHEERHAPAAVKPNCIFQEGA